MNEKKTNTTKVVLILLLIILLIILVLGSILMIPKITIFNSLLSLSEEMQQKTNYSIKMTSSDLTQSESFVKGENYYQRTERKLSNGETMNVMKYRSEESEFLAVEVQGSKILFKEHDLNVKPPLLVLSHYIDSSEVFKSAFQTNLKSIDYEDKKCYEITFEFGQTILVEKDTGLIVKLVEGEKTTNISYEFDGVTDENIQKPDLTGYVEP